MVERNCLYTISFCNKKAEPLFHLTTGKSKAIKVFLQKALDEKWVAKDDIFWIVKNTYQSKNIWEYLELKEKLKKEEEVCENV